MAATNMAISASIMGIKPSWFSFFILLAILYVDSDNHKRLCLTGMFLLWYYIKMEALYPDGSNRPYRRALRVRQSLAFERHNAADVEALAASLGLEVEQLGDNYEHLKGLASRAGNIATKKIEENKRIKQEREGFKKDALTDSLTVLPNRRALDQHHEKLRTHGRRGAGHSILFVDVDNFKEVNDKHTAVGGDIVLRGIASCLVTQLRESTDFVGRHGGDEFVVFLSETDSESARKVAHNLRTFISVTSVPIDGIDVPLPTVSIGVDRLDPGLTYDDVFRNASLAMKAAKDAGRDQVVVIDPQTPTA